MVAMRLTNGLKGNGEAHQGASRYNIRRSSRSLRSMRSRADLSNATRKPDRTAITWGHGGNWTVFGVTVIRQYGLGNRVIMSRPRAARQQAVSRDPHEYQQDRWGRGETV
jgi:hypothetical protein